MSNHRGHVARGMFYYARKYCWLLNNLGEVANLPVTIRPHVLKGLSALSKFLGRHEEFRRLVRAYGLKWRGKSQDDLVIERLTRVKDSGEVWAWVRRVKAVRPELSDFMDFISVTGLRLGEAIESYNLIIQLSREGKLREYYNEEKGCLEHYKFKQTFIRKSKKAFISFCPRELIQRITCNHELLTRDTIYKRIQRAKLKLRLTDIREAHASILTRHLSQPEIDFLHGRVTANVFMSNYFNPALIGDLKERAFKAIAEIQAEIQLKM